MTETPRHNPDTWDAPSYRSHTEQAEQAGGRIVSRLEAIRQDPVAREKARRIGTAAARGALGGVGVEMGPDGALKVKPVKVARSLMNPTGAATRALKGTRKEVRAEAMGIGREMIAGQFVQSTSETGASEAPADDGWGETPSPEQPSDWSTPDAWAQPTPSTYETSAMTGPTESDSGWGEPLSSRASSRETTPVTSEMPKKGRFESQRKFEERVVADMAASVAQSAEQSDSW